jgi:L-rhamnose isomerase/sugar isomerase
MTTSAQTERIHKALDTFVIELPSWGFANTGTRFGQFIQDSAATTMEEKLKDAGQVQRYTACCPTVATHVLWDFPEGLKSTRGVIAAAKKAGVRIGSINPNVFQDQIYKNGSLGNPDPEIRKTALNHILDCVEIGKQTGSHDVSPWFADGSSYPGTASIRHRKKWFEEGLRTVHEHLSPQQRLLVEYKPFEPYSYHMDLGDWCMALILARYAGPQARVLVDTGHHYQAQNIEQIVAWLLSEDMLGGFHFNDRRYADDDLTLGSIDPYQVFRIFNEIIGYEFETGKRADIAYMIDQSHNLKNKVEEMIQTAMTAQELYSKAVLVDHEKLTHHQMKGELIDAEECLKSAFATDVRPAIQEWRKGKGLAEDPLHAFRASGYTKRAARARGKKNQGSVASYA